MQFATVALSALSIGSAFAASSSSSAASSKSTGTVSVHVVKVGNSNGSLTYSPNQMTAAVGDMIQFQFAPANHTVTQSTFDQPCQPISLNSNVTGIFSGFMPVSASSTTVPTYTVLVNSTTPMWLYCSQGRHCQSGMVMVVNVNPTANATRTLANYQALAAKASANLAPSSATNGTSGTTSGTSGASGSSGSSGTSGSSGASGTSSSSGTATSSPTKSTGSSGATAFKASDALSMGGLFAIGMALFI